MFPVRAEAVALQPPIKVMYFRQMAHGILSLIRSCRLLQVLQVSRIAAVDARVLSTMFVPDIDPGHRSSPTIRGPLPLTL